LAHLPIAGSRQLIDLGKHPGKQGLSRYSAYPGPLERLNVFPLAVDLTAHMLDFGSDMGELHGANLFGPHRTNIEHFINTRVM
jgi:hypothetical protein